MLVNKNQQWENFPKHIDQFEKIQIKSWKTENIDSLHMYKRSYQIIRHCYLW